MCEACEPLLETDAWKIELEPGHSEYEKIKLSEISGFFSLTIYPKPYKPYKFFTVSINYCPFCGQELQKNVTKRREVKLLKNKQEGDED